MKYDLSKIRNKVYSFIYNFDENVIYEYEIPEANIMGEDAMNYLVDFIVETGLGTESQENDIISKIKDVFDDEYGIEVKGADLIVDNIYSVLKKKGDKK